MNRTNFKTSSYMALSALVVAFATGPATAAGWGTLKGKFVLDGTAPKPPAVDASKDAFCVSQHPVDQTVVVGKDSGIANIVVYLKPGKGEKVEVHPDFAKTLAE